MNIRVDMTAKILEIAGKEYRIATKLKKNISRLVDLSVIIIISILVSASEARGIESWPTIISLGAGIIGFFAVYYPLTVFLFHGTIGHFIAGLKIISIDDSRPSIVHYYFDFIFALIGSESNALEIYSVDRMAIVKEQNN